MVRLLDDLVVGCFEYVRIADGHSVKANGLWLQLSGFMIFWLFTTISVMNVVVLCATVETQLGLIGPNVEVPQQRLFFPFVFVLLLIPLYYFRGGGPMRLVQSYRASRADMDRAQRRFKLNAGVGSIALILNAVFLAFVSIRA